MGTTSVGCGVAMTILCAACAAEPAPGPIGELVGTWRYLPADTSRSVVADRQIVVFGADGRYEIRDASGTQTGTYRRDGHDVTITSDAGAWVTTGVAATADRLIVDALFPDGDTDGLVGTWAGTQASSAATATVILELRADGSGRIEQTGPGAEALDGTWTELAPYAVFTFAGTTFAKPFPALPDVAIGEWLYERLP